MTAPATGTAGPAGPGAPVPDGARAPGRRPFWHLLVAATGAVVLVPAAGPLRDFDVFWHVRMGDLILRMRSLPTAEPWNFPVVGRRWVPHAWLSEVTLSLAHRFGGWGGVVWLRLLLGAVLLALLARNVLRDAGPVAGPVTYVVAAITISLYIQDRPQLFALVLLAALVPLLERARAGTAPRLLVAAAVGWLWASLHGSWPLLPALLVLSAIGCVADRGRAALPDARRLAAAAAVAVAGAALTPVGPALLTRPFAVSRAASELAEWQPPVLWAPIPGAFALLVAALVYGWARAEHVPRSELLWAAATVAAALNAGRNIAFATVLLAPLVARRLPPGTASTVPTWAVRAVAATGAALLVGLTVANPDLPADSPTRLMAILRDAPGQARVLNDYNVGGYVTGFGGDEISAAIDGRVDAYPAGYLRRYLSTLKLVDDWEGHIAELKPTHALLDARTSLARFLERERGWRRLGEQEPFVLLQAP